MLPLITPPQSAPVLISGLFERLWYLYFSALVDWVGESAWLSGAALLKNSWLQAGGFAALAYRVEPANGPKLRLKGTIFGGTVTNGTLLFTLPTGFEPSEKMAFAVPDVTNLKIALVTVDTAGNVKVFGAVASAALSFDGITIPLN